MRINHIDLSGHGKVSYVNNDLKLIIFAVAKTGTTSIRNIFNAKECYYDHNVHKDYKKIIIIRDPLTRIVSAYTQTLKPHNKPWRHLVTNSSYYKQRNNKINSFELFIELLENVGEDYFDAHVIPQHFNLKYNDLTIEDFDYVIDFSRYQESVLKLMKIYNINKILLHKNKKAFNLNIIKYENRIKELYKKDMELYEYVKQNNMLNKL